MSKWSTETTLKFIREYRSHEFLWNNNLELYRDKQMRKVAYNEIVEAMGLPDFGVAEVKNKIKNLRSTFNQEKKKVAESKKSGGGKNSVYESNLKWLTELEPTMIIGSKRKTVDNDTDNFIDEEEWQVGTLSEAGTSEVPSPRAASPVSMLITPVSIATTPSVAPPPKKKIKSLLNAVKDLHAAVNADEYEEDCFDIFGRSVAAQLRKLSEQRALLAQKDIQNILSNYGIEDIVDRNNCTASSPQMQDNIIYDRSSSESPSPF